MPHTSEAPAANNFKFHSRKEGSAHIFELEFTSNPRLVQIVRKFVTEFYGTILEDEEAISQLALVTHELMENAVKYSANSDAQLAVELHDHDGQREVRVKIRNPAKPENVASVGELLEQMNGASSPLEFYVTRMQKTAREQHGSGLGLVRICAEAGMKITHQVQGDWMEISATTTYPSEISS